ncbi:MAPEG family protein [Dongia sp.]|uniref:MAPEG family protein n=1 Tax=Dongia sp. TaxID=1977262 RepID=UPI0035AEA12B
MPGEMSTELTLLIWSVVLCIAQMLIAVMATQMQVGLPTLAGNRDDMPPLTGLAGRATRAHRNMLENLPLFAALALVTQIGMLGNDMTALGAQLFFWGRAAYAVVYLIGLPWVRTGSWAISMAGLVLILTQLF